MARRKKLSFLWILIPIILLGILLFYSINYLINPQLYRNVIQKSLSLQLGREVTIGKARINLWEGIGISFEDLIIKDRSFAFDILRAKRLTLVLKILPLLKKEVKWKRVILDKPYFLLTRDRNGQFNFLDGPFTEEQLKDSEKKIIQIISTIFGGSLIIRDGIVNFSDELRSDETTSTEIRSFELQLSRISYNKPFPFRIQGKLIHAKKDGQFSINGTLENILEDMDIKKGRLNAEVELKRIEISHFWPYLKRLLPMELISGTLDLKGHYEGSPLGPFKVSAKVLLREVAYQHSKVFAFKLTPEWMNIDFDAEYNLKDFMVPRFSIELPDIKVKGKGRLYEIGKKGMGIDAEASSSTFDISHAKKYIPYRIITPDVSNPLFRGEGNGLVQILSVRLSGKIPEIEHCDQLKYSHTLKIEMKLIGAKVKLPWDIPPFENLKGYLLFQDGNLNMREMEGKIFNSTIERLQGTFYQLLQIPTLQISSEGRIDLEDLLSWSKMNNDSGGLPISLSSLSSLSGKARYQLSLNGELKPPIRLQHQGIYHLSRIRFTHSKIPFPIQIGEGRVELSNENLKWSGMKVEFGNTSVMINGWLSKEGGKESFEFISKGQAEFKNLLSLSRSPIFSEKISEVINRIEDLSGSGQFYFRGKEPGDHRPFIYEMEVTVKDISILLRGVNTPFTLRDGSISISNLGTKFLKLKIQSINSSFVIDGSANQGILNLSTSGSINLRFLYSILHQPIVPEHIRLQMDQIQDISGWADFRVKIEGRTEEGLSILRDGDIQLRGVSLQHQAIPVPLSNIEGSIVLSRDYFQFIGLKIRFGNSPATITSIFSRPLPYSTKEKPERRGMKLSFQISSSNIDLDSIFPKKDENKPFSFEKLRNWLQNWVIDGKLDIERGKFRGLIYQDLKIEMRNKEEGLLLYPFQFKAEGGDFWGEGLIKPSPKGIRFEIKPRISNMEVKPLLRILLQRGNDERIMIAGRIHVYKVNLKGEGENFQQIKESLNGQLRIELENGVIEKGNILSKIFSLLNVSQLFQGRLPDLKTKGLPYRRILANVYVKDGVASTDDLVVDSDAMRITLIGNVDLGKNQIDAKIGIHPLVTVDKILSNIPIAGYILTGKDKGFISYFYEVKGNLSDPEIEGIPFKGIGEKFLGIFKRLLETPFRPFQKNQSKKEDNTP